MQLRASDLLAIAIRVMAIWVLVYALSQADAAVWVLTRDAARSTSDKVASVVLGFGLPLLAAVGMWVWAHPAATRLCRSSDHAVGTALTRLEVEQVVLFGIGAFLFASRVASLTYWLVFYRRQYANDPYTPQLHPDYLASICRTAVELALGVWFLRGAPGLYKFRGASIPAGGGSDGMRS